MRFQYSIRGMALVALLCGLAVLASGTTRADEKSKTREVKVKDITMIVPKAWKQQPPANKLRLSQFLIPASKGDKETTELVVSSFGGGGGGLNANINRWVGQFQSKGRKVKISTGTSPQGEYVIVDVTGTYNKSIGPPFQRKTKAIPGARMLSVILAVEKKGNYFLKMTGPAKSVTEAADAFRKSFGADAKKEKELDLSK